MLLLKACPHCGGDLATEQDRACGYLECVQCSHVLSRDQERALGVRISRRGVLTHESPRRSPARRARRRT
jgi:hypothetical protein